MHTDRHNLQCADPQFDDAAFEELVRSAADFDQHRHVRLITDAASGLRCLIAVHNTARGPGVGGCRFWHYDDFSDGLTDVLRLSRGMTYKNAMADLSFGGGKAVIFAPTTDNYDRAQLMTAFGRAIEVLHGDYCTAEDVGTSPEDMDNIQQATQHIFGLADTSGDPSPFTAYGCFLGLQEAVQRRMHTDALKDVHITIQGLGHVGYRLCELLHEAGARLTVSDVCQEQVKRACESFAAQAVEPDAIYEVDADVYAPCALGATVNPQTLDQLSVKVIAGAANNQLSDESLAEQLTQRQILYAPDYIINAGGIINIACETGAYNPEQAQSEVEKIASRLRHIFTEAEHQDVSTVEIANKQAQQKFERNQQSNISIHKL